MSIDRKLLGLDTNPLTASAPPLENNGAIHQCEQGVIPATSDVGAGVDAGPTLTYKNSAGFDLLPPVALDTEVLRI